MKNHRQSLKTDRLFLSLRKTLFNRDNGFPLLGFVCAEMVYFMTAYYINSIQQVPEENLGLLFPVIALGVFAGSTLHFLVSHKKYHLSYKILTSSIYCLAAVLIGLLMISAWLFNAEQSIAIFIGAMAFLGALYIPLVYSQLFQILHARHRGMASAIGENAQGLASLLAALLMGGIHMLSNYIIGLPYLIAVTFSGLYFVAFFLSLGGRK